MNNAQATSRWKTVAALVWILAVSACVTNDIPGGSVYNIDFASKSGTLEPERNARYKYGRYEGTFGWGGGGGITGIGYFNKFYQLEVEWASASGIERKENLDVADLISAMTKQMVFAPSYKPSITLLVFVNGENISLYYVHRRVHDFERVASDHTRFLLFSSSGN